MSNKWDNRYLNLAREVSTWSKDPSTQVGAVAIGEKGQVLAQGYNGFPRGVNDSLERYNDKEVKYRYVVHAEMNCIYNATFTGASLNNATMYVWGLPVCNECAKGLAQVGVKRVVSPKTVADVPDKWKISAINTVDLLKEVGITYDFI
ncbi:MAG TPA: CMP deaminase [Saprospirales bacterium]|nr:CMP deaminase [Saprospirales bacterium]